MGSQSRRFRASEAVDSELVYLYLLLFLCLGGFLKRPADYGHTYQNVYHGALNSEQGLSEILATANPGAFVWEQRTSEVIAIANPASNNFGSIGEYSSTVEFDNMLEPSIEPNDHSLDRLKLDSSGALRDDSGGSLGVHFKRMRRSPVCGVDISCRLDPEDDLSLDSSDSFRVGGTEQIELGIDYKIPKGRSTESSWNLPSSAFCLDSIPKMNLTLLRNEKIKIMWKLGHVEECSNDTGIAHYDIALSPDTDFELRAKVISILVAGIFTLVITLTTARKRMRNVILFQSNNELNALILQESDLDDSYLADQILYENLLKEAVLISSKGSSGQVFKVRFLELECAMKVFHSSARMDFRRESITLLNLSHPHIVKVFCSFRKSFIVMELMDEDLFSFLTKIREGRIDYKMPLEVALDVMLQIAEGMSYLHHQGIAHQDLKSLNILLKLRGAFDDPDFQIIAKVADFGSARRFNPRYPTGFVFGPNMNIGTRSWKAPELFHPRGSFWTRFLGLNPRVLPKPLDVYGFAVICSELLTKQIPFSNDEDLRVAVLGSKVREGHRPALPSSGCPEGLLTLIKECWHPDPVLRPEFHEVCARLVELKSSWMSRGQSSES